MSFSLVDFIFDWVWSSKCIQQKWAAGSRLVGTVIIGKRDRKKSSQLAAQSRDRLPNKSQIFNIHMLNSFFVTWYILTFLRATNLVPSGRGVESPTTIRHKRWGSRQSPEIRPSNWTSTILMNLFLWFCSVFTTIDHWHNSCGGKKASIFETQEAASISTFKKNQSRSP